MESLKKVHSVDCTNQSTTLQRQKPSNSARPTATTTTTSTTGSKPSTTSVTSTTTTLFRDADSNIVHSSEAASRRRLMHSVSIVVEPAWDQKHVSGTFELRNSDDNIVAKPNLDLHQDSQSLRDKIMKDSGSAALDDCADAKMTSGAQAGRPPTGDSPNNNDLTSDTAHRARRSDGEQQLNLSANVIAVDDNIDEDEDEDDDADDADDADADADQDDYIKDSNNNNMTDLDEDDLGFCLSSDLARRVIIVDEADKILRSRALSESDGWSNLGKAEQQGIVSKIEKPPWTVATAATPTAKLPPPIPPRSGTSTLLRSSTIAPEGAPKRLSSHRFSLSSATCSGGGPSATTPIGCSAQSQMKALSMRRSTHHHVNFAPELASSAGSSHSSSSSTALQRPNKLNEPTNSNDFQTLIGAHQQAKPVSPVFRQRQFGSIAGCTHLQVSSAAAAATKSSAAPTTALAKTHRRQSLQINLFGPVGLCSSCSTKSLTEEELRGEREFNKQVRSSKSPELITSPTCFATLRERWESVATSSSDCQTPRPASESSSLGFHRRQSEFSTRVGHRPPFQTPKSLGRHLPGAARRRVSFSSVDPIVVRGFKHCANFNNQEEEDSSSNEKLENSTSVVAAIRRQSNLPFSSKPSDVTESDPHIQLSSSKQAAATSAAVARQSLALLSKQKRHSVATSSLSRNINNQFVANFEPQTHSSDIAKRMNDNRDDLKISAQDKQQQSAPASSDMAQLYIKPNVERPDTQEVTSKEPIVGQETTTTTTTSQQTSQTGDASRVQSIMASARLRQEEFAKLLEEHKQIVNEINRVETKISSSQTSLRQSQENK